MGWLVQARWQDEGEIVSSRSPPHDCVIFYQNTVLYTTVLYSITKDENVNNTWPSIFGLTMIRLYLLMHYGYS
jgi:hypothetical protein